LLLKNSTIEGEYLAEFPNINYKKVCIFMGANASGKTSLGRMMCKINNYLAGRPVEDVFNRYFSAFLQVH
jgi:ABC-type proline/glycine betaine transport system ATPase subunit